jgi:hypothetical protein
LQAFLRLTQWGLLSDPHGAMDGKGRNMRAIPLRAPDEIDPDVVAPIPREAAAARQRLPSVRAEPRSGPGARALEVLLQALAQDEERLRRSVLI